MRIVIGRGIVAAWAVVVAVAAGAGVTPAKAAQDCKDWQACRTAALEAAESKEYDTFHDLAWRTLNLGPKNDPALMLMLARAQSLSGHPLDALVMLQRLDAMGVATDALTNDDFARVRALPGWPALEAKLSGKPAPEPPPPSPPVAASAAVDTAPKPVPAPAPEKAATAKPAAEKPAPEKPAPDKAVPKAATAKPSPNAPLNFAASGVTAVGLGYDAVSGRFIFGDKQDRRLLVVGERSGRLASLAGVDAGFSDLTAFEIDTHEGDLWVVSTSSQARSSTVHKLQLISGRVLASIALPEDQGPGRFTDVAVTPLSILVLDSSGRRIFRVAKKGRSLELAARLATPDVTSLAPASDTSTYAAYDEGILHVDLITRALTVIEPRARLDLSGVKWLRWYKGSLVAIQTAGDRLRLVRIRLDDAGRTARSVDVIADDVTLAGPTSATISGTTLYYLSRTAGADDVEVRKVTLK